MKLAATATEPCLPKLNQTAHGDVAYFAFLVGKATSAVKGRFGPRRTVATQLLPLRGTKTARSREVSRAAPKPGLCSDLLLKVYVTFSVHGNHGGWGGGKGGGGSLK